MEGVDGVEKVHRSVSVGLQLFQSAFPHANRAVRAEELGSSIDRVDRLTVSQFSGVDGKEGLVGGFQAVHDGTGVPRRQRGFGYSLTHHRFSKFFTKSTARLSETVFRYSPLERMSSIGAMLAPVSSLI